MHSEEQNITSAPKPFRVCPACGQLTPSNEAQCIYCGALSPQAVQEQEERRFFQALFTRATPITYGLVAINVIYYFIVSWFGLEMATLIAFGAKTNSLLRAGDWFRLVMPIFIHGGLLHLFFNSYVLWVNGPLVERLYGSARFLLIYLLSGIGGVVGSYAWQEMGNHPDVPSVGASGALFGLFGLLAVFGYKYKEVPPNFQRALRSSVLPAIVINLIIGFSVQFIDNGGHIGGLVTGVILAFVIPYLPPSAKGKSASGWAILTVCILVIVLSFAATLRQLPRHMGWRVNAVNSYLNGVRKVEELAQKIEDASASTGARGTEMSSVSDAIAALQNATAPVQRSTAIRDEILQTLRQRQDLIRSGATSQELHSNLEALDATLQKFDDWYKTDLQRQAAQHGLRFEQKGSQ